MNGNGSQSEFELVPIRSIQPSPQNNLVYRPIDLKDPDLLALAQDIRLRGILEPIVVTSDRRIVSGHRRYAAATLAGVQNVKVRVFPISSTDPEFIQILTSFNQQRVKSLDEFLRETMLKTDPEESYGELLKYREERSQIDKSDLCAIELREHKKRADISSAKTPFLKAIEKVIHDNRKFWPLSVRQIHYRLLNHPPLIHASKADSRYCNTLNSYRALVELLARARLIGKITWSCIADETRPVSVSNGYRNARRFIDDELSGLLRGYWRNLVQSQPNHVEIVGEKNTIQGIIRPVAGRFCIPYTIGRGYCSLIPRKELVERYRRSGKQKLVLLVLSDFDPDGEEIAHSFARSLRDDFNLVPILKAKAGSSNCVRFVERHGDDVYELEAIRPTELQEVLEEAIKAVIDIDALNHEIETEKKESKFLVGVRNTLIEASRGIDFGTEDGGVN
jgi:hypothetical protein